MRADDRALVDLAASVADGTPVDWQAAEARAGAERRLVRHLRLVDSIAALHRSIPAAAPAGETPTVTEPEGRRWGRLILVERIGEGTSCEVFKAWDTELHRHVALKLLHDSHGEDGHTRMLDEARRVARLRHEHVVQVYGAEQHDGRVGLWMELVRGTSLERLVQERGAFGDREAALIGLDVCSALAAVHGAGLLHRDVKAQNVMREEGGRLVLMDFGTGEELAGSNRMVGTPLYLAPEIFRGQRASVQSDVYSVGVLLFYLVSGKFPVMAGSIEQLARAHATGRGQSLRDLRPDVSQRFLSVLERAIDTDPLRRHRTVGELESALREAIVPQPFEQPRETIAQPERSAQPRRIPRRLSLALGAAALLVLMAGLILWNSDAGPSSIVAPSDVRLAVLPFRNESASAAVPYLADELTDELISTLGQIRSIRVTSLSSVLQFKEGTTPVADIARRLNVDHVVDATLLVTTDRDGKPTDVRIKARLLAAGSGSEVWAKDFQRSLGDTHALQSEVARTIAAAVEAVLTPEERRRLEQPRPSTPQANDAYFQGLHYLSRSSAEGQRAVDAFRRAIQLDPDHAGARAGLARALMSIGFYGLSSQPEARALATAEVNRALALDPDSSEAHAVQADLFFYYDWDWKGADRAYRRAIGLNPSFARARSQYARYLAAAQRREEAVAEATRAADLEPTSASAASTKAIVLYYARDFEGAQRAIDHALQLESASASAHLVLARIQAARHQYQDALESNRRALALAGAGAANSWRAHELWLHAVMGEADVARRGLTRLPSQVDAANGRLGPAHFAYVHAALGDRAMALTLLERAASERDPDILWLAVDPRVDQLRSEPRFEQLLERLGPPR
jgi:eukaryotic-like serine/threonine-protein kinase